MPRYNPTGLPRWDDIQGSFANAAGTSAWAFQQFGTSGWFCYFTQHNQDDTAYFTFQMPHSWDYQEVEPHIHIVPMVNPTVGHDTVFISCSYAWATLNGDTIPLSGWTGMTASIVIPPSGALKSIYADIGFIPAPSGARGSDILMLSVSRPAASSILDTYDVDKSPGNQANLAMLYVDMHFRKDKHGSINEVPDVR